MCFQAENDGDDSSQDQHRDDQRVPYALAIDPCAQAHQCRGPCSSHVASTWNPSWNPNASGKSSRAKPECVGGQVRQSSAIEDKHSKSSCDSLESRLQEKDTRFPSVPCMSLKAEEKFKELNLQIVLQEQLAASALFTFADRCTCHGGDIDYK